MIRFLLPRQCPGKYLAESEVWIVAATLIAVFDILPTKDGDGNSIIPPTEFRTGFIRSV